MKNLVIKQLIALLTATSVLAPAFADTSAKRTPESLAAPKEKKYPDFDFPDQANGKKAYDRLEKSGKLKEFAEAYDMSPEQVKELFLKDSSAHTDRKGRLLFIEKALLPNGTSDATPSTPTIPLTETFLLHSKPNSSKTVYLDFNGHTLTGTSVNTSYGMDPINAVGYDIDGIPGSFNNTELAFIQGVWKRVSEDFAAFDVNITTQEPPPEKLTRSSASDNQFGIRTIIAKNWTTGTTAGSCGCGGFAYVGVFASTSDLYKIAFAFSDTMGNVEKNVADVTSHEIGHIMGLSHDGTSTLEYFRGQGTGETRWAPIMGAAYNANLTQWSKGEYTGANNQQDDYLIMQQNGAVFDKDDHGDSPTTATAPQTTVVNGLNSVSIQSGLQGPNDIDVFMLNSGIGPMTIKALPFVKAPSADLLLTLKDASGNVLSQSNELLTLGTLMNFTTPSEGTYYLSVEGTGKPDPLVDGYTKYGNVGTYTIAATYPINTNVPPVAQLSADVTSGLTPLTVNFSAAGSSDANGSIVSYDWDFGDGTTGTGATVSKTYNAAGDFTAALVVTDNGGLRSGQSTTAIKTTSPVTIKTMSVGSLIVQGFRSNKNFKYASATVKVVDANGAPLPGVSIGGSWSGVVSGNLTAITDSNGTAVLKSLNTRSSGTATFTVKSVTGQNYTYDSNKNVMTSASVTM
ncbi:MAG: PKD domain-containing protein [Limnobacter sp.]|nr:PKD domain-containing protein [Limnobacter sp.]